MKYNGLPINGGIEIGRIRGKFASEPRPGTGGMADADVERMRFFDALLEFEDRMKKVAASAESREGQDIISGQIMIARDPVLSDEVLGLIDSGMFAHSALNTACARYEKILAESEDEMFRARIEDLYEVKTGILELMGAADTQEEDTVTPGGDVIFADRLSAAEIIGLKNTGVRAVVMKTGTSASHAAVLLRSMGIVAVFGVEFEFDDNTADGNECIVDGIDGLVITDPTDLEKDYYRQKKNIDDRKDTEASDASKKCTASDGTEVEILCNLGSEVIPENSSFADGVGLLRTEFMFMEEGGFPTEDVQFENYSRIADAFKGKNVVIRTLDEGGDKDPEGDSKEENPALGRRGIRLSLADEKSRDIFRDQLKAILRAGAGRELSVLIPMISSLDDLLDAKKVIGECMDELEREGKKYSKDIKTGCMIETPAALMCLSELADNCDFFSIGTNDLSQYIMCADRGNPGMSELCSIYQPAVIRAVKMICDTAAGKSKPVTVCGEAASDVKILPALLGMGIRSFSVDPTRVTAMKKAVKVCNIVKCEKIAEECLSAGTKKDVIWLLDHRSAGNE